MKNLILILLVILVSLLSSCDKEEVNSQVVDTGYCNALKNGAEWSGKIILGTSHRNEDELYIAIKVYNKDNILRESLFFSKISKGLGSNPMKKRGILDVDDTNNVLTYASYYTSILDGDVGCDSYQVADSVEVAGYVNVTKYDEQSGVVEGTFEVTLVKEFGCDSEPNAPNTIHFTKGVFSTKVQD